MFNDVNGGLRNTSSSSSSSTTTTNDINAISSRTDQQRSSSMWSMRGSIMSKIRSSSTVNIASSTSSSSIRRNSVDRRFTVSDTITEHKSAAFINDVVIIKTIVREAAKDRDVELTLTTRGVCLSSGSRREILDIHSVVVDANCDTAFYIRWFKNKQKIAGSKMRGSVMRSSMNAKELLQVNRYDCRSHSDQAKLVVSLEYLVRTAWQFLCEESPNPLVIAPEVYQIHSFVVKINRKGIYQDRVLVLSNVHIYNIEVSHCSTTIKDVKWCVPIKALEKVVVSQSNDAPALAIVLDEAKQAQLLDRHHRFGRTDLPKAKHHFCLNNKRQINDLVCEIRRLFYALTQQRLFVEQNEILESKMVDGIDIHRGEFSGYLLKYRKNMKGKPHRRFVKLSSSGLIQWGDSPSSNKFHEATITSIEEGFGADEVSVSRSFIIYTSGKTLMLVADTDDDYNRWMKTARRISRIIVESNE